MAPRITDANRRPRTRSPSPRDTFQCRSRSAAAVEASRLGRRSERGTSSPGDAGFVHVSGWALDPDDIAPISVYPYIDGVFERILGRHCEGGYRHQLSQLRVGPRLLPDVARASRSAPALPCCTELPVGLVEDTSLGCRTSVMSDTSPRSTRTTSAEFRHGGPQLLVQRARGRDPAVGDRERVRGQ